MPKPSTREWAFEALLPVSEAFTQIVAETDQLVAAYIKHNLEQWAGWIPAQMQAAAGTARFYFAVQVAKGTLADTAGVAYVSTLQREAQNLFLWQIAPSGLGLRFKREPQELDQHAAATLFDQAPEYSVQSSCFTWEALPDGSTAAHRFTAGHGAPWSIMLADLVAASRLAVPVLPVQPAGAAVRSARPKDAQTLGAEASDTTPTSS